MAAIEAVAEEVATNLEEVAEVTRRINGQSAAYFGGGLVVGVAVGFFFGRRWMREKIKAEAFAESQEEIAQIRESYKAREMAKESLVKEKTTEEIVAERGYSTAEPPSRPLAAPVPVQIEAVPGRIEETVDVETTDSWSFPVEELQRSPEQPYVIHHDEFNDQGADERYSGYRQTAYTYYAVDDVIVDTDDTPVPHADMVVGQENLKWGHGSGDPDIVFIRNERLELEIEITRVPRSYEEEVLGHNRNETN